MNKEFYEEIDITVMTFNASDIITDSGTTLETDSFDSSNNSNNSKIPG